jgi:membrane protein
VAQSIGSALGLGDTALTIWNIVKWPVMIAVVVWILASIGFGFYVANFSSYNKTYGSLAGVIVFLLWLWITNIALLFGAEVDSEVERGRQLQGGIAAEETLQLPPRDTRASDKMAEKEQADLQEARTIRDGASAGK